VDSRSPAPQQILGTFPLLDKQWLNTSYFRLRIAAPEIAANCRPGQFVNVRLAEQEAPLLRRPMSIFRRSYGEGWIEVLVKQVGRGTRAFGQAHPGDLFDLLGPLGNGFQIKGAQKALLVGGGIGIAPLVFLAEVLQEKKVPFRFLQGFRSGDETSCVAGLRELAGQFLLATDDGSAGYRGTVADLLEAVLNDSPEWRKSEVYVCGPDAMMNSVARVCRRYGLSAQFSVEAHMACGFGACMGCAVPAADGKGYRLVCVEGPVFKLGELHFAG